MRSKTLSAGKPVRSMILKNTVYILFAQCFPLSPFYMIFLSLRAAAVAMNVDEAMVNPTPGTHFQVII